MPVSGPLKETDRDEVGGMGLQLRIACGSKVEGEGEICKETELFQRYREARSLADLPQQAEKDGCSPHSHLTIYWMEILSLNNHARKGNI